MPYQGKRKRRHSWPLLLSQDEEFKSFLFPSDEMSSSGTKRTRILEPNHQLELLNIMRGIIDENIIEWNGFREEILCIKLNERCGSSFIAEQVLDEIKRMKRQYNNRFDQKVHILDSLGKRGWENFVYVFSMMSCLEGSEASVPGSRKFCDKSFPNRNFSGLINMPKLPSFQVIKKRLLSLNLPQHLYSFAISRVDIQEFRTQIMTIKGGRDNVIDFLNDYRKKL